MLLCRSFLRKKRSTTCLAISVYYCIYKSHKPH
uniref:Uncharacterized protein n=1 Tax=Anguilla anguilla TaxID=7936 RepID=A0A0E9SZU9_ANGAN